MLENLYEFFLDWYYWLFPKTQTQLIHEDNNGRIIYFYKKPRVYSSN